ncbi:hypothetical protein [Sulfobacillus sp. hq2]|uniref:Uncharacterized protein n=1 Tax=Sulfobacillus thermotolerans TaxID=338644 RepID=A0ABM6RPM1_9FIRM|nr:hypothetical protein [Sulfobacillus sp. hq2]AUW93331.1 hypothetical protein BXT84_04650 [Sulfobacillus thermotolerans]MCY0908634.1 hypothetical protein [Sulfobacillus thermotolerans]POB10563.1 hypothetical protein CO251_06895 [Sulfobacillus sp. hq2]
MGTVVLSAVGVDVGDALWILIPTAMFVSFGWWMLKWLGNGPKESAYGDEYPKWLQPPSEDRPRTLPPTWAVIRGGKRNTAVTVRPRRKTESHHSSS